MAQDEIPNLCFSSEVIERGSESWKTMSEKVREACENYGCFVLKGDQLFDYNLRQKMVMAIKTLFDLPEETKQKHTSAKPFEGYSGNLVSEAFGIGHAPPLDATIEAFTRLMWPQGNSAVCEVINSMNSRMAGIGFIILRMILDSFGMEKHNKWFVENLVPGSRLMKYNVPTSDSPDMQGLGAHTDKNSLTILGQNEVQGLQILTKQENWIQPNISDESFIIIIGDTLKAWSNGKLQPATHRVIMRGDKERYSWGIFFLPEDEVLTEAPQEFIDKDHPLLYRPFKYPDYLTYCLNNPSDDALEIYTGV